MRHSIFSLPNRDLQFLIGKIWCLADTTDSWLTGIRFTEPDYTSQRSRHLYPSADESLQHQALARSNRQVLSQTMNWLNAYFAFKQPDPLTIPLRLMGTPFQQTVWQSLQEIPYGETRTYRQIAQQIGRPKAIRAVGAAISRNPWLILVPCHRVIGQNGSLTGYAGGLARKSALLRLEQNGPTFHCLSQRLLLP